MALLRFGELLLDLLGVEQAFRDSLPALFQHRQDRLVGELSQEQRDDDEADDLREEDLQIRSQRSQRFRATRVERDGWELGKVSAMIGSPLLELTRKSA